MKTIHEVTEMLARKANRDQLAAQREVPRNSDEQGPSNAETRGDESMPSSQRPSTQGTSRKEPSTSGIPENSRKRRAEDSEGPEDKKRRMEGPQGHEEASEDSTQKNRPTPRMASVEEGRREITELRGQLDEEMENLRGQGERQLRDRPLFQRPSTSSTSGTPAKSPRNRKKDPEDPEAPKSKKSRRKRSSGRYVNSDPNIGEQAGPSKQAENPDLSKVLEDFIAHPKLYLRDPVFKKNMVNLVKRRAKQIGRGHMAELSDEDDNDLGSGWSEASEGDEKGNISGHTDSSVGDDESGSREFDLQMIDDLIADCNLKSRKKRRTFTEGEKDFLEELYVRWTTTATTNLGYTGYEKIAKCLGFGLEWTSIRSWFQNRKGTRVTKSHRLPVIQPLGSPAARHEDGQGTSGGLNDGTD